MKKYIYLLFSTIALLFSGSCSELTDLDLLENPNKLSIDKVNPDFLFNEIQFSFYRSMAAFNDKTEGIMRYASMRSSYFGAASPSALDKLWTDVYKNRNNKLIFQKVIEQDNTYRLHGSIINILNAFAFATLVDYLGDIPYSNTINLNETISPAPENGKAVYEQLLAEIDLAITGLNAFIVEDPKVTRLPLSDLYFNPSGTVQDNDVALAWLKAANSLKLKMLVNIGDEALSEINALLSEDNLINAVTDDFQFKYLTEDKNPDSRHPGFVQWYNGSSNISYLGNDFILLLKDTKEEPDPRLRYYMFRQAANPITGLECESNPDVEICNPGDRYLGKDHADVSEEDKDERNIKTVWGRYPVGGAFDANNPQIVTIDGGPTMGGAGITPILLSSYVQFLKAEAVLSIGANGDAKAFLEAGIRESMVKVMGFGGAVGSSFAPTQADIDSYVDEVLTAYDVSEAVEDRLDIVIREYYLAAFGNSIEAYNAYRRTGFPSGLQFPVSGLVAPFSRSFSLPSIAVRTNNKLDQRPITNQVFWDKNPDNFIN